MVVSGAIAALMVMNSMRSRIDRLADFKSFLNDILINISYSACELFYIIQKSSAGFASEVMKRHEVCGELSEAWNSAAEDYFSGNDLKTAKSFFEEFGRCDVTSQQEKLKEYIYLFSELEKSAKDSMEKKGKARASLCFFISVTAVLIMI